MRRIGEHHGAGNGLTGDDLVLGELDADLDGW
jgi:hypothetical protein